MSRLSKADVGIIATVLKKRAERVELTAAWQRIYNNFQIGRCVDRWLYLSRKDHKELSALCVQLTGVDPRLGVSTGGRAEVAVKPLMKSGSIERFVRVRFLLAL